LIEFFGIFGLTMVVVKGREVLLTSKTIQVQMALPPVPLASKSKPKAKLFAQAVKANVSQQTPRFAPASSYEDFLHLLQLKEAFPNLPQATIISMHQASLGSANASQESSSHPSVSRTLKIMIQEPTKHQVLVPLDSAAAELIVANTASAVQFFFFFFVHQFITRCSVAVRSRLSTTSSLQF